MARSTVAAWAILAFMWGGHVVHAGHVLTDRAHHLRSGQQREWDEFAEQAEGRELVLHFTSARNAAEQTLRLRQRDVKQPWRVRVNGRDVGTLVQDETQIVHYLAVPAGTLRDGENELRVECTAAKDVESDDVSVGEIELVDRPTADVLTDASLHVAVDEEGAGAVPCRITIADDKGARITLGTPSGPTLAVRPGVVYAADGRADLKLPAGRYTVYAGRGFEYGVASAQVDLAAGQTVERKLSIRRVVSTPGWVACDTHVHTLTYSRHGDATVDERMLTLAGEGIELPISTEHNLQIDYAPAAEKMNVRRYFTPVIGNEVTTAALGHFNVFPIAPNQKLIDWRGRDWDAIGKAIRAAAPEPVVILNHARDIHGGFRPFDPSRHIALTGEQVDGPSPPANAMEVINSGATMNDPMRLYRDWFGMLNAGHRLTPIGSSDSHDVARYIVGQGRTYIRCDDADPGKIDVEQARQSLLAGRVIVSYGLLCTMSVAGKFGPGDLVPAGDEVLADVTVLGPEWVKATRVTLYVNGVEAEHFNIPAPPGGKEPVVKWHASTRASPKRGHDYYLVAVATGPGLAAPYWPGAKPYQPTSSHFDGYVIGSTGAVFVDADGSGKFESARDYAEGIVASAGGDPLKIADRLRGFDAAVAAQTAAVLRRRDPEHFEEVARKVMAAVSESVKRGLMESALLEGFEAYLAEWRQAGGRPAPR